MARKLIIGTAVATLALAGPAWAASPLDEYQQSGHITPCRYSSGQLQGSVPNDVAQYAPEYQAQLQAAARQRASGCGGAAGSGGSAGRGTTSGGSSGGSSGSNSAATGAGGVTAAAATARRARARRRAQARLAAATVAPAAVSSDSRVPDRALLLAALPILLLLALAAAIGARNVLGRRRGRGADPPRTRSGAIILPAVAGAAVGNGNGNGDGTSGVPEAEAPTEEVAAVGSHH